MFWVGVLAGYLAACYALGYMFLSFATKQIKEEADIAIREATGMPPTEDQIRLLMSTVFWVNLIMFIVSPVAVPYFIWVWLVGKSDNGSDS